MFRKFYKANITGSWKMVRKNCASQIIIIPTVYGIKICINYHFSTGNNISYIAIDYHSTQSAVHIIDLLQINFTVGNSIPCSKICRLCFNMFYIKLFLSTSFFQTGNKKKPTTRQPILPVATCNSYTMCARDLTDIYTRGPRAAGPRAEGVYISQITSTHGITNMCHLFVSYFVWAGANEAAISSYIEKSYL